MPTCDCCDCECEELNDNNICEVCEEEELEYGGDDWGEGGHSGDDWAENDYGYEISFQDPGGNSALRRETVDNPRNLPCPECGEPDRLTPADVKRHYRCDECANRAEGWGG